ncbi:MAG: hypothetical protein LBR19_08440, partial [Bifidobacteriaceae bacterium]|nr:hypothetical protein [Bifidobacteriaceae bacterium]
RTSTGATVYFAGNVAVTWDSSRPLSAYGNVSAKNMYGRAVTAALSTVTPDKSHPYLLTGVTIRPGNAEAAVAPNPSTAAAANPFRLEAAHVYLNGADLGTTAATSRTDPGSTVTTNLHDSTVPVSQGDVVRIEARARDAQNNNVATSTQFTCQAGAGLTLQSQGLTGGNYYCQYLVGQVSSRSRTYGSGYPWSVPSYVQVVGSRAGNTDTSRVALSSSAVVTISGRGYLGQQMTASTTVSGVTWAWYRVDYNGQETPATNANGNLYTVGAGDFAYNTWGMGVRIVARAYKDGQMVAEGYFRPSRWPVEGWASAEGLTASDGTIRLAGNAWSFDWDHLESGGAFLVTVGGTCSAGGEQHLVKANQPWLESQALEYPQVVGGLYGFDVTFTTQLRGQQMVHVYPIAATWQIGDACPSEDATSHGDANEKVLDLGNSPVEVQVVEFTGRGYWGQQMTASTVVTGVTWSWFRIGFDGVESPVTNGNAVGNVYTVGAGDFAYNTWGQGVKIVARAYKSGQLVAEGFFRPSRLPVEGWASAEGLSAANGTVHFAGNAWAFDWDHLTAGGSFLVTLGGTCSAGGERHLVKANRQWLEWSQAGEYPQVVGGLYGFDATFTTQLHGLQTVNVYPVAATWQVGDVCPSEDATSHGSANGSVLDLGTAVEPLALSSVVLAGSATVGSRLTVTASYTPADAVVNYVWYRGTSVIQGVSGTSYTLTALDAGKDLVVKVTASHGGVTTAAKYSNHVLVPGQPLALNAVVLSGSATVGSQLTVAAGYTPLNAAVNYVWYRGTSVIQGVTGTAYTLTAADAGQDLVVKVTASFGGVTTAAKYSNHLIVLGVSRLAVVGTAQVGRVLTVDLAYAPAGAVVEYRWYRGVSVVGTAANYVVQPADVGQDMVLKVTVSLAGVGSYSRYSAHFFPVV